MESKDENAATKVNTMTQSNINGVTEAARRGDADARVALGSRRVAGGHDEGGLTGIKRKLAVTKRTKMPERKRCWQKTLPEKDS